MHVANDCLSVCPDAPASTLSDIPNFNFVCLAADWRIKDYSFYRPPKAKVLKRPDATFLIEGGFAFRSQLLRDLFPIPMEGIEFLPVRVEGEEWFAINCLVAASNYDTERSIFFRGLIGQIFMVNRLVLDNTVEIPEIFVIDGSKRAVIYVSELFAKRVRSLCLNGIGFRAIGEVDL